ncbi:MAG: hypothetical protein JWN82_81 [Candidatus Saccharibacteria bacterium]|nr:hypothetical protein [Candidatus Saccharibacteria bacterium]
MTSPDLQPRLAEQRPTNYDELSSQLNLLRYPDCGPDPSEEGDEPSGVYTEFRHGEIGTFEATSALTTATGLSGKLRGRVFETANPEPKRPDDNRMTLIIKPRNPFARMDTHRHFLIRSTPDNAGVQVSNANGEPCDEVLAQDLITVVLTATRKRH